MSDEIIHLQSREKMKGKERKGMRRKYRQMDRMMKTQRKRDKLGPTEYETANAQVLSSLNLVAQRLAF